MTGPPSLALPALAMTEAADDARIRCGWPNLNKDELYQKYHDEEWGKAVSGESQLFERLMLEAFQSGLSWLTILRKRENFRKAFDNFDPAKIANYGEADIERLLNDAGIVRNRLKINATINNAKALLALPKGITLKSIIDAHKPEIPRPAEAEIPAVTKESTALAKSLKKHGFVFVGPTTAYAMMQAIGIVNDHEADCWVVAKQVVAKQ